MTSSTTPGYPGTNDASLGGSTMGTTSVPAPPGRREEPSNLASEAGDAGRRVTGVAKGETKAVGHEARRQARRLADQVGSEVRQQAAHQQSRAATGLRNIGDEFSNMADGSGSGSGFAADVAREAGNRVGSVAQWLDERDPKAILSEVKSFARRRPGVFLAIAAGAGVVVGRLTRALAQPSDESDTSDSWGTSASGTRAIRAGTTRTAGTTATTYDAIDAVADDSWAEGNPTPSRGGIR